MAPVTMASTDVAPIRISRITSHYLVFDPVAAAQLRRNSNINGTLVGTVPQQPTQNMFLGLPIEIRAEEAAALVHAGVAYIDDHAKAHRDVFSKGVDPEARKRYVAGLRADRLEAQRVIREAKEREWEAVKDKVEAQKAKAKARARQPKREQATSEPVEGLFQADVPSVSKPVSPVKDQKNHYAITPTTSYPLIPAITKEDRTDPTSTNECSGPLVRYLQNKGYFIGPGLRFGCMYSVYPGDPLRFHAHFMANEYAWEETIPILDIVGGGRLATAVKKAFVMGGLAEPESADGGHIRTYSIEWASM